MPLESVSVKVVAAIDETSTNLIVALVRLTSPTVFLLLSAFTLPLIDPSNTSEGDTDGVELGSVL